MNEDKMRKDFEAIIAKDCGDLSTFGTGANMHYKNSYVNHEWIGYKMGHRAATRAAVPAWQPIETAPRHGRELILLLTPSKFPQVAYSNSWHTCGFSVECKPTHWMPLPLAPEEKT